MTDQLPQLHMRHTLTSLPELITPSGFQLRSFRPDDGDAWGELMNANGELGAWDTNRIETLFAQGSMLVPAGSFFITHNNRPVATAQFDLDLSGSYAPLVELGWVAARPEYQGLGLGYVVCLAVLQYARAQNVPGMFLKTDDPRLPAIATYLKLGFTPWMFDETAPDRWRRIMTQLETYRQQRNDTAKEPTSR